MEKNVHKGNQLKRILITGPESTGKSDLAVALAHNYRGVVVPEYARAYIENLGRSYEYMDVESIAEQQLKQYNDSINEQKLTFFDTWLIVTRVWFELVYDNVPAWIDKGISQARFDMVLLCATDIPWVPDLVRENGGAMREKLLDKYKYELDKFGMEWVLVTGTGEERQDRVLNLMDKKIVNGTL